MKRMTALILALLLLCGAAMAEYDLSKVDRVVFQTSNGIYRMMDLSGRFIGEDSEEFPSDEIDEVAGCMSHGEFGYVAKDGTVLIEPQFESMPTFDGDYAVANKTDYDTRAKQDSSGVMMFPRVNGVLDRHGDTVVPFEYSYIRICDDGKYAIVARNSDEGKYGSETGLYDLSARKLLIEPQYYDIGDVADGVLVVTECEVTPDPQNESGDEYAYASGILSVNGEVLLPIEHESISYVPAVHTFIVRDGDTEVAYKAVDGKLEKTE